METELYIETSEASDMAEVEAAEVVSDIPYISADTDIVTDSEISETTVTDYNLYYVEKLDNIEDGLTFQCGILLFFMVMLIFISLYKFTRSLF